MQYKIKDAVDQDGENPRCRTDRDAPPKQIVSLDPLSGILIDQEQERQADQRTGNAAVSEHLQIIVVCLFDAFEAVKIVVGRVCLGKGPEAAAERQVAADRLDGDGPDMGAVGRNVL